MFDPDFSTRLALAAAVSASLLALAFTGSALAADPVVMGGAQDYSVIATTLTSNGPTAMSDNLGVSPGTTFAGDTAPIVLGETHLGDTEAAAAMDSLDTAYGNAVLQPSDGPLPANLGGQTLTPGVYDTGAAMGFTAGTVLTLDAGGNPGAVFVMKIGAALTVGASAQVNLVGGADPCNVFWAVTDATSIGANAKFAGTVMSTSGAIGMGAGSRLDGRALGGGIVTLSSNAIRTACTDTVVVPGPAGPAGPAGAQGIRGEVGPIGADGAIGLTGTTGGNGTNGTDGTDGTVGMTKVLLVAYEVFPARPRAGRRIAVRYALTDSATTTLTVKPKKGKAVQVASRRGRKGANTIVWNGRLGPKMAKAGRYKMTVTATRPGEMVSSSVMVKTRR